MGKGFPPDLPESLCAQAFGAIVRVCKILLIRIGKSVVHARFGAFVGGRRRVGRPENLSILFA